jgi:DMSO/TMAO reductase YedYZ molybdopterin-dependent catalytic subunit
VAQTFRGNGTLSPRDDDYVALRDAGFADYRLTVGGLVAKPAEFTLEQLRAMPSRTQITRHDCVEGWSCVGKWKGVQLARILDQVQIKPEAKFVLFRCFDSMEGPSLDDRDSRYYESIDLDDAHHVQTILAYELNDKQLPVTNGAPLRCRVERQLGYKQAKYIRAIELVESFAQIRGGKGGYWEDEGYEWYGGI